MKTAVRRGGGTESDFGLYAQDDWTLGDLVLTAGARADRWTIRNGYYTQTPLTASQDAIANDFCRPVGVDRQFSGRRAVASA